MESAASDLNARICRLAVSPGQIATALPDVWLFRADASLSYVRGYSPQMNVAVAASGRKTIRTGRCTETNDPEHYLVLHGNRHYEAKVEASVETPYIALKLRLPPDVLGRTLLELADLGGLKSESLQLPPPAFVGTVERTLAEPLLRLLASLDDPVERRIVAPLCMHEIALRLLQSDAASLFVASLTREHLRALEAMRFIEKNAGAPLTVEDIARTVAMSPSHFAHRFREFAGISPIQYAKTIRLERARLLLLDENIPVNIAAEKTGYANTSHFSRDFRKQFGVSPSNYSQIFKRQAVVAVGP